MNRKVFLVMPFILLSLLIGTYNGLLRIGWALPVSKSMLQHGAIMVGSFLGTLILLERIVVFKKGWLYLFPIINGISILFFVTGQFTAGMIALLMGAAVTAAVYIYLYYLHRELFLLVMLIGAISLIGGYIMLLHSNLYPAAVPYWIGFVLLTVSGERLELTKFLPVSRLKNNLLLINVILFLAGLFISFHGIGHYLTGISMILFAAWMLKYDIAFKSVKLAGIHRYIALNLIAGYGWLFISGLLLFFSPDLKYIYDATLHTFFLGYAFSMILGHGPIILPGVAGVSNKPYHPALYLWGAMLQVSLILRITADFFESISFREFAGLFNVIAIIGFFANVLILMKRMQHKKA
jgi:hypothetical protein